MTGRTPAISLLIAAFLLPALAWKAPAQDAKSLSIGTFHSPKGLGLCMEVWQESTSFDTFDIIADMFGVLNGSHSKPGIKATYCRDIVLKHIVREEYDLDLYAGPGITAGYVRDINEPLSFVAGMTGSAGCRLFFDSRRVVVCFELGVDLAAEVNRNNRFRNVDLNIYKSGILHSFYPQVRLLWQL